MLHSKNTKTAQGLIADAPFIPPETVSKIDEIYGYIQAASDDYQLLLSERDAIGKKLDAINLDFEKMSERLQDLFELAGLGLSVEMFTHEFDSSIRSVRQKNQQIVSNRAAQTVDNLVRHINYNDVIVVGNKRDILPRSIKDTKIIHWLRRQLKLEGIKPLDVLLTSGKKNYHLDELMQMIDQYRKGRDVYVVGVTNVGKSSLINSLLKAYSDVQDNLITTSEFPGTTLDLIEIPLDENSSIYDSPGIVNRHQIAHLVDENTLKDILPQSELRPVNYQLNCKQTLYFGGLARLDFLNGSKTSMTCYFHRRLQIHRTKLENADALYNRHKTLKPEVEELKDIQSFKTYQFRLPENKVDVVISGLGFVTIHCPNALIEVKAPEQVGVFIREALI